MGIHSLKRVHWLAISLVLGLALGELRQWSLADLSGYGETLNSFDNLQRGLRSMGGEQPLLKGVRVHRQSIGTTGGTRVVDVVCADYCETPQGPTGPRVWHPAVFVAEIPFHPAGHSPEALALRRLPSVTVLDYLNELSRTKRIRFTHAWWDSYPLASFMITSVLVIGLIWPTFINLWLYGRLTRPPEPKGIDLSRVTSPSSSDQTHAEPTADDLARLQEIESQMQQSLEGIGEAPPVGQTPAREVPVLSSAPLESAPELERANREFGAREDDYYPTERRANHRDG